MNIFHIALNNLRRRKIKVIFLMLGLVVGIATVVAVLNIIDTMKLELGDRIDEFGANAIVLPRTEGAELHYGNIISSELTFEIKKLTMEDINKIYDSSVAEYINIVSPKIVGTVEVRGQKVLLVGIDHKKEFTQKPWFSLAQQKGITDKEKIEDLALLDIPLDSVIIGSSAAKVLRVETGDKITLNNQTFEVFGILNPLGGEEDGLVYANLSVVQELLDRPDELSMIEISAYCNSCPIEEIAMGLDEALENGRTIPLRQAALFREETIKQFSAFGLALAGTVLLISSLIVLTTMLSAVNERTREIGIFRAIGFRKTHIMQIIFLESVVISFISGFVGYLLGNILARYAGPPLAQLQSEIPFRTELALPAIFLSMGVTLIASAYPAIKAAKLDPVEALRFI